MGVVSDTGQPDLAARWAAQHAVEDLPAETLNFLLASRYCETDRLSEVAWNLFGQGPMGWGRVQAICDFVHRHIVFGYEHAHATTARQDRPRTTRQNPWPIRRRNTDVAEVAGAIACRYVHAAARAPGMSLTKARASVATTPTSPSQSGCSLSRAGERV